MEKLRVNSTAVYLVGDVPLVVACNLRGKPNNISNIGEDQQLDPKQIKLMLGAAIQLAAHLGWEIKPLDPSYVQHYSLFNANKWRKRIRNSENILVNCRNIHPFAYFYEEYYGAVAEQTIQKLQYAGVFGGLFVFFDTETVITVDPHSRELNRGEISGGDIYVDFWAISDDEIELFCESFNNSQSLLKVTCSEYCNFFKFDICR